MKMILKALAGLIVAAGLTGPALAELHNPAGVWVTGTGETKFEVHLCGDGDDLCGSMIWLGPEGGDHYRQYVNQPLMDTARRVENQRWQGQVFIFGRHLRGIIEIPERNRLVVRACDGMLCESINLYRVE